MPNILSTEGGLYVLGPVDSPSQQPRGFSNLNWVAVKELGLSYYTEETLLVTRKRERERERDIYIYTHYGT